MNIEDLNNAEIGFIEIIRVFGFLFKEGYHGKRFSIGGREPGVCFENWVANREVIVFWSEDGYLDVWIKRKKMFANPKLVEFSIRDYFKHYNCESIMTSHSFGTFNILKQYAGFIQQNIMPVIKGEMWIDELIKVKNKY